MVFEMGNPSAGSLTWFETESNFLRAFELLLVGVAPVLSGKAASAGNGPL